MNEMMEDRAVEAVALREPNMQADSLKTIRLSPDGQVESLSGSYIMDLEGATLLIQAFKRHGVDKVIDFEHASEGGPFASPDGMAPAAGWITSVHYEAGRGLFGLVKWNPEAAALIRADKYRYLSPVLWVRKSDRRAVALKSAALTNTPAIPHMEKLAASTRAQVNTEPAPVTVADPAKAKDAMERLRELLGAGEDIGLAELLQQAVAALEDKAKGKDADAEEPAANAEHLVELVKAASTMVPDPPGGFIPKAQFDRLIAEKQALEEDRQAREADALLEKYALQNKLCPANDKQMAVARAQAMRDPESFTEWMEVATPLVATGRTVPPERGTCERVQVIGRARTEYRGDPSLAKTTSEEAFISLRLQEKGLSRLSQDEIRLHDLIVG